MGEYIQCTAVTPKTAKPQSKSAYVNSIDYLFMNILASWPTKGGELWGYSPHSEYTERLECANTVVFSFLAPKTYVKSFACFHERLFPTSRRDGPLWQDRG